jgi:uncharacterized membrane protein YfcA
MIGFIIVGFLSGIISGMGIGGGTILIPAITMLWGVDQKVAQITNLIYFIPTASIALITHLKNKNIEKDILLVIILFGFLGAIAGSYLALTLNSAVLRKLFGGFLFVMGIIEFSKKSDEQG